MDQTKIGSFLKELRKQKGLTQEQLAEEFNVASRTVSRWETGNNMPDLAIIHMLEGIMIGITGGALIVTILYATGVLAKIRAKAKENGVAKRVLIAYLVICALMVIAAIVRSFV